MGGSKSAGGAGQTYDYYGTLAGGLCVGPVDEIVSIILNGSEAWPRGTAWVLGATCVAGTLYVYDAQTWTCTTTHVATSANAPGSGLEGWTEYTFKYHGSASDDFSLYSDNGTFQGVLRLYWGTSAQTVDYYLQSANNDGGINGNLGSGDQHPDYKGVCYCVLIDFLLGQEVQSGPNVEIVLRRAPNQAVVTGTPATIVDGQANLAAALCEILTDPNCLGLPTTMIDATSFQAVANYLQGAEQNYNGSILIDTSESLRSLLDKFIQMMDGWMRFNATTQKIELGVYEHGVSPATYANVVTLTADCFTKKPQFKTTSWQGTYSRATVRYNSRQLAYQQTSVQADDPRAYFVLGEAREQALDRPYIAREAQALFHGRETLRVIGHAQMTGTLEVRREFARTIAPGDFVFVDVDLEPGGASIYQYFRVTQMRIPPTGPITLDIFADNTLAPVPFSTPYPTTLPGDIVVNPITALRLLQVPNQLSGEINALTVLARRPDNLIAGCQLYFDTSRVTTATVSSLVSDGTGANGVITFSAAPGFAVGDSIDVSCSGNSAFNVNLGTVTAVSGSTVTYALVAAIAPATSATGTITVADYYTTFSNIGVIPNFAANATLYADVADADGTITVTVDTTQADADYFTYQYTANDAADDTMLLFLVAVVASGTDAGQVDEASGYQIMEICSVSTQTLVPTTANRYQLTVLRGRQGTEATAFAAANTECWLIPRSALAFFVNGAFDSIRLNRTANTVPQYAQFRFCPYTYAASFALSNAVNHAFRFPLKSEGAPVLELTTPTGVSYTYAAPERILVAGTWTDVNGNLVQARLSLRLATEASERVIFDNRFAACDSYSFSRYVQLDTAGSWTIKLWARDSTGAATEYNIAVTISGGTAVCATPEVFDCNGNAILNGAGADYGSTGAKSPPGFGGGILEVYKAIPTQFIPFGPIKLRCSTPGATIYFYTLGAMQNGGVVSASVLPDKVAYDTSVCPFHQLLDPGSETIYTFPSVTASKPITANYSLYVMAEAPGYARSKALWMVMPLLV